jgi:hypothetical protein
MQMTRSLLQAHGHDAALVTEPQPLLLHASARAYARKSDRQLAPAELAAGGLVVAEEARAQPRSCSLPHPLAAQAQKTNTKASRGQDAVSQPRSAFPRRSKDRPLEALLLPSTPESLAANWTCPGHPIPPQRCIPLALDQCSVSSCFQLSYPTCPWQDPFRGRAPSLELQLVCQLF